MMSVMSEIETFRQRVEQFLERTGMPERSFGLQACNDTAFVTDLRAGMEPRTPRRRRVEKFMLDYRAPGAAPRDEGRAA